jgi:hypothetical protein
VTRWTITRSQVGDGIVFARVSLGALSTFVLEYALVPRGVGSRLALVYVGIVDKLVAHDGTPMTLGAWVVVVGAPLADVARLAATTVRDLTLCRLHAHGLKGASNCIQNSLRTVVAFRALANRRVRDSVETCLADVTSDTFINLDTCAAIEGVLTVDARFDAGCRLVFIHSWRADRLTLNTKVTF